MNMTTKKPNLTPQQLMEEENPLDSVLPYVLQAVLEWKADYTEEKIKQRVKEQLDENVEQMVLKLLGFDTRYDKWDIDHCNGRSGESAIGDYMRQVKSAAIKEFFDELTLGMVITPAIKAELIKEVRTAYAWELSTAAREYAGNLARKNAGAIVEKIMCSTETPKVLKLMEVIKV